jgi:hypothetical protein
MWRLFCLFGWHNWWDAGEGEFVCLDCGRTRRKPAPEPEADAPDDRGVGGTGATDLELTAA